MFQTFLGEWELIESMLLMSGPLIGSRILVLVRTTVPVRPPPPDLWTQLLHQRSSLYTPPLSVLECNPESLEILQDSPLKRHERTFFDPRKRHWRVDEKGGGQGRWRREWWHRRHDKWVYRNPRRKLNLFVMAAPLLPPCSSRLLPSFSPLSSVMTIHQHYRNLSLSALPVH